MAIDPQDQGLLDRLNETERDVLRLLGRGHTAKSIATLRGLSVAAVNERLRAGRRKTGVSSSRELARLLSAQENRDDLIGLAADPATAPGSSRRDAAPFRRGSPVRRWSLPMIAATVAAAALLAQQTATPPVSAGGWPQAPAHPAVRQLASQPSFEPQRLHAEVASGARDPAWSSEAEARLTALYGTVPDIDVPALSIRCVQTLCEVAGTSKAGLSNDQAFAVVQATQTITRADGLQQVGYSIGGGEKGSFVFLAYWRREG